MKEITRIHLAATPFNIEIGAKEELEKYLDAVESALQADTDALREIEARIIELLNERGVIGEKVITSGDIDEIKHRLGSPADFLDDDGETDPNTAVVRKRLMRDNEAGLLGGVLAGIGAYLGIHPNWVRVIAVALTFVSLGTVALIYVVLWIALPVAKTAAEKLQMAGKPVTLAALKEGADISVASTGVKPLVIMCRVLLGLGFVGAALVTASVTAMSLAAGIPIFASNFEIANGWLIAAFALFVVSGILLTLLMIIAAYATGVWRMTRGLGYTSVGIIIAGVVLFSAGIGAAFYGGHLANSKVNELTKVHTTKLDELQNTPKLVIESDELPIEYRQTSDEPRAEITSIERDGKVPTAKIVRDGEEVKLVVKDMRDNKTCFMFGNCAYGSDKVVIYGPALTDVRVAKGTVTYDGEQQSNLSVDISGGATFAVQDTTIETVTAKLGVNSSLNTEDASVTNVAISGNNAWVTLGVITAVTLSTPTSCPSNSAIEVSVEQVEVISHNGIALTKQAESNVACAVITIRELEEADDSTL